MPLSGFERRENRLYCGDSPLDAIVAEVGTPCYVYSGDAIVAGYRAYADALTETPHEVHFAVKANGSLGVLALLAQAGAGFDIVSGGELYRVIQAGGDPSRVVFSGVGKTRAEMKYAIEAGIGAFHCESEPELEALAEVARELDRSPSVALRVNPDVNAETHPYIATGLSEHKFGVPIDAAEAIYRRAAELAPLRLEGVSCHIGSQIFDTAAFFEALDLVLGLVDRLRAAGVEIIKLDLGGGLGIAYRDGQETPSIGAFAARLAEAIAGRGLKLMLEPGRSIVGQAGVLLTNVVYRKPAGSKVFVIVDAAMNDLIRPALYQSHHEIVPVALDETRPEIHADIVGPICESGDFLARDRSMRDVKQGETLAVCTAGAYGFVLSSNYNARPRAAEVLVKGASRRVIREREGYEDLIRGERA